MWTHLMGRNVWLVGHGEIGGIWPENSIRPLPVICPEPNKSFGGRPKRRTLNRHTPETACTGRNATLSSRSKQPTSALLLDLLHRSPIFAQLFFSRLS